MTTNVKAIVTDIEGTTTSLSFVKDVLFPYAESRMVEYLNNHKSDAVVKKICDAVRTEINDPRTGMHRIVKTLLDWAKADKKVGPLKELQGLIWEEGYRRGDYKSHIYSDAAEHLRKWHTAGIPIYVYSSGSVHAQKLLFKYTSEGDLSNLFSGYFDTNVGNKKEAESYRHIASAINLSPSDILFLSDVTEELEAAAKAGMQTYLLIRDSVKNSEQYRTAHTFSEIRI